MSHAEIWYCKGQLWQCRLRRQSCATLIVLLMSIFSVMDQDKAQAELAGHHEVMAIGHAAKAVPAGNRRIWLLPSLQPAVPYRAERQHIAELLKQGQAAAEVHAALALLERTPHAPQLHLSLSYLFRHYQKCQDARPYFRKLQALFANSRQAAPLRQLLAGCGLIWRLRYQLGWQTGYSNAVFDAPPETQFHAESGSALTDLCARVGGRPCGRVRILNQEQTHSGMFNRIDFVMLASILRGDRVFQTAAFDVSKMMTGSGDSGNHYLSIRHILGVHRARIGSLAFDLRLGTSEHRDRRLRNGRKQIWKEVGVRLARHPARRRFGYQTGVTWRWVRARLSKYRQVILHQMTTIKPSPRLTGHLRVRFDRQQRQQDIHFQHDSVGAFLRFGVGVNLSWDWALTVTHRIGRRQFSQRRPYLAKPHQTREAVTFMRIMRPLNDFEGAKYEFQAHRRQVWSADVLSRRDTYNLGFILTYRF